MMQLCAYHEKMHEIYRNTNGTEYELLGGHYYVSVLFSAQEGERTTGIMGTGLATVKLEHPLIEEDVIRNQLRLAQAQLSTMNIPEKFTGPIILTQDCLNQFLYYTIENLLSENNILNKTSLWLDQKGKQIADPRLTVSLNPLDFDTNSGERYTKDGYKSENYDVIKDGWSDLPYIEVDGIVISGKTE